MTVSFLWPAEGSPSILFRNSPLWVSAHTDMAQKTLLGPRGCTGIQDTSVAALHRAHKEAAALGRCRYAPQRRCWGDYRRHRGDAHPAPRGALPGVGWRAASGVRWALWVGGCAKLSLQRSWELWVRRWRWASVPGAGAAGGLKPGNVLAGHTGGKVGGRGHWAQPSAAGISLSDAAAPVALCHSHAGGPERRFHYGTHHQGAPVSGAPWQQGCLGWGRWLPCRGKDKIIEGGRDDRRVFSLSTPREVPVLSRGPPPWSAPRGFGEPRCVVASPLLRPPQNWT
jgi:hypothetical protein